MITNSEVIIPGDDVESILSAAVERQTGRKIKSFIWYTHDGKGPIEVEVNALKVEFEER